MQHGEAIHARHHDVEQHELRMDGSDCDHGIDAIDGFVNCGFGEVALSNLFEQQDHIRVVVGDQDVELVADRLALGADGQHVGHAEGAAEFCQVIRFDPEMSARQ